MAKASTRRPVQALVVAKALVVVVVRPTLVAVPTIRALRPLLPIGKKGREGVHAAAAPTVTSPTKAEAVRGAIA